MSFAITTVSYNNRDSLSKVILALISTTIFPPKAVWYFVLQNCTDAFCKNIVQLCQGKIEIILIRFAKNIGLSKSLAYAIEHTKYFDYVLALEDDWIAMDTHIPNQQWLLTSLQFLEERKDVSTLFLRAYRGEGEKFQYGWTRHINYICHKHKDNFNYQEKIKGSERVTYAPNVIFTHIPRMLLTWNPTINRNSDFHEHVYPIPIFDKDTKMAGDNANWSCSEGLGMERTLLV